VEVRVAKNNIAGAQKIHKDYKKALRKVFNGKRSQIEVDSQLKLDYLLKDFDAMEKHLADLEDDNKRSTYLKTVYLNRGDMEKLDAIPGITENSDSYSALLYWLGWLEKGNPQKASQWLIQAKEYFQGSSDDEEKQVGQWLEKPSPGFRDQLDELSILPEAKRILYTAFARLYSRERKKMLARAEKMNYLPRIPHHFLAKTIRKMK
jgi:hypothetical protein